MVLSACNTAGGEAANAEAFSGLARAFFYAGSRALLVSHWPVNSDAAVYITTGAIGAMAQQSGIGPAEALRRSISALAAKGGAKRASQCLGAVRAGRQWQPVLNAI